MSSFDYAKAERLWREIYDRGYDAWNCPDEVVHVGAKCGLGVVSVEAMLSATKSIRAEYDRSRYAQIGSDPGFPLRWARHVEAAARAFPVRLQYPITKPDDHAVGRSPCFGQARKGSWTAECFRAAWGNVEPYGLESAEKPCPRCNQLMQYWCWGRNGDPATRWAVDHVEPHVAGGCVCHFNLHALHPACNSSKGGRT